MLREEILSSSIEREPFPTLVLVGCASFSILLFIAHLSFRLGKPDARWHHSGHMRGVHVLWGFSAFPGGMAFGAGFSLGLVDWLFRRDLRLFLGRTFPSLRSQFHVVFGHSRSFSGQPCPGRRGGCTS